MTSKTRNGTREIRSEPPTYVIQEDDDGSDASSVEGEGAVVEAAKHIERTESDPFPRSPKFGDKFSRTKSSASLPVVPSSLMKMENKTPYEEQCWLLDNDVLQQKEVALGKRIGMYRLGKELGSGNFSKVKLGVHVLAKEKVAVKIMDKTKMDQKAQKLLAREISAMEKTLHPHIIRLFECVETLTRVHLVLEYAGGGELYTFVHEKGKLKEEDTKILFSQVVAAVAHMHANNLVHRDIKAENILFTGPGHVKLGDFGFSCIVDPIEQLTTFCGSPPYAAPELLKDKHYNGTAVDMWAMGVLLYFMLVGITPFKGETLADLKETIIQGSYSIPEYVSFAATNLIKCLLEMVPEKRLEVNDVKRNLWLNGSQFNDSSVSLLPETDEKIVEKKRTQDRIWRQLTSYGISEMMVVEATEKGPRHAVTGIYRIIQYQTEQLKLKQKASQESDSLAHDPKAKLRQKLKNSGHRSKTCVVL